MTMVPVKASNGVYLSKLVVIGGLLSGLGIILLVGLLVGLVARPNNCIKPTGTSTTLTTTTPTSTTTTSTTSTSTTSSTTSTTRPTTSTTSSTSSSTRTNPSTTTITSTTKTSTTSASSSSSSSSTTRTASSSSTTRTTTTSSTTPTSSLTQPSPETRTVPTQTTKTTTEQTTTQGYDFRLPSTVYPKQYDLTIKSYFDPYGSKASTNETNLKSSQYVFYGQVTILLDVVQATNRIELHMDVSLSLDGTGITLEDTKTNQNLEIEKYNYLPNQLFQIVPKGGLKVGEYRLKIGYDGRTRLNGFYAAEFTESSSKRTLMATRFEPTNARTAFPCFDEPSFKAEFTLTIEHPARSKALSNFQSQSTQQFTESGSQRLRTKFQKTYRMSTYLLAWSIIPDDFEFESLKTEKNVEIRVYARRSAIRSGFGKFGIEVAKKSIDYFSSYFGVDQALPPKIDLIALPQYPEASSPSWGLNSFHEDSLLFNENTNSRQDKQNIALAISKELVHYWLGNYVTCTWWDDLWLNEALATFFQYKSIDYNYRDWDIENQYITDRVIPIMWEDGFASSRPIKFPVNSESDLIVLFDDLVFSKGSAIIRMLEDVVGADEFKKDMNTFLTTSPFGNVTALEFYNAIRFPSNLQATTEAFLETWLLQENYPVVAVNLRPLNGVTRVEFTQGRFLLSEIDEDDDLGSPFNYKWNIKMQCKAGGTYNPNNDMAQHVNGEIRNFDFFLQGTNGYIDLDRRYTWVKCNTDFKGFYVTDYTNNLFKIFDYLLVNRLDQTFSIGDRINLIHNAFELAFLGSHTYQIPSLLVNYLQDVETKLPPFKTFIWHINKIANIIEHRSSFKNLRGFIIEMLNEVLGRLNVEIWDNQGDHQTILLKTLLVDFECRMQSSRCLNKATKLFETIPSEYFISPNDPRFNNTVSPNYRPAVYKYHLQNSYEFLDWQRLYDFYEVSNNIREDEYVVDALANTRLNWLLDLYLDKLLDEDLSGIKNDDILNILNAVGKNPNGRYFAWYYVREFYYYFAFDTANVRRLQNVIRSIIDNFDNIFLLEEVEMFFVDTYDFQNTDLRIKALDTILNNIYWVIDKEGEFQEFFFDVNRRSKRMSMKKF